MSTTRFLVGTIGVLLSCLVGAGCSSTFVPVWEFRGGQGTGAPPDSTSLCFLRVHKTIATVESIDGIPLSDSIWIGTPGESGWYYHSQGVTLGRGGSKSIFGEGYDYYDAIRFPPGPHEIEFSWYEVGGVTTKVDLQALSWGSSPTAATNAWRDFKAEGNITGTQVATATAAAQAAAATKIEPGPMSDKRRAKFKFQALPGHEYIYYWKERRIKDATIEAWVDCEVKEIEATVDSTARPAE